MLLPHQMIRQSAWLAHGLADEAREQGDDDRARYFDRVAAEASRRADRLLVLERRRRQLRGGPAPPSSDP